MPLIEQFHINQTIEWWY